MKKLVILMICLLGTLAASAQVTRVKLAKDTSEKPLLIINDAIIAGESELKVIPKNSISEMEIIKDKSVGTKNLFADHENPGLLFLTVQDEFVTKSQSEVNEFFGLDSKIDVYINGYLVENKKLKILSRSIDKVEIMEKDQLRLKTAVLNISLI
ncbi:hypothetical protein [Zunongwangia endophytica]|uniref:TonB-dependent receptor n=1 Tax=Zunongwangia endophytica TaxID=1808945 RepID=A0ABV8H3Q9_9FLAO|nr:hypothetical protein [Zunongwangia endophytica]MDN3595797.1 hypothetical protein [Zunongwangia endophytica]